MGSLLPFSLLGALEICRCVLLWDGNLYLSLEQLDSPLALTECSSWQKERYGSPGMHSPHRGENI